jgi:type VI secretion system protein ImpB
MAEGSYPPKERVNIVYKPATGGAKEEVELPFKIIAMGDYTLKPDTTPLGERKPQNVNKDTFNGVMREQNLGLTMTVPNRLSENEKDTELSVHLRLESLKDFEPGRVIEQIPELAKLLELRQALSALKGPLGNMPAFRKAIQDILKDETARSRLLRELNVENVEEEAN